MDRSVFYVANERPVFDRCKWLQKITSVSEGDYVTLSQGIVQLMSGVVSSLASQHSRGT